MNTEKKLQRFGYIQSMIFATSLTNNLICFALISLVPGFGKTGVIISAGIMLFFSGLIEVPTGIIGDKFGRGKVVIFGFTLKIISTLFMIGAVIAALQNSSYYIWPLVVAEALFDATGSSLISGSYQGAYNAWYGADQSKAPKPLLFLASYKFSFWPRVIIPFIVIFIGLNFIDNMNAPLLYDKIFIITPLVLVLILRVIISLLIRDDLKGIVGRDSTNMPGDLKENFRIEKFFEVIFTTWRSLICYSFFRFAQLSVIMVALAETYKILQIVNPRYTFSWSIGLLLALTVHLINVLFSRLFYQKISQVQKISFVLILSSVIILFFSTQLLYFLSVEINPFFHLVSIYVFCIVVLAASQLSINFFQSMIPKIAPQSLQASWPSCAEFVALMSFSCVLGISLFFNYPFAGLIFVLVSIIVGGIILLLSNTFLKMEIVERISLKHVLVSSTCIVTGLFVLIFGLFFFRSHYVTQIKKVEMIRALELEQISYAVRTALLQGSFVEAAARIKNINAKGATKCMSLFYNKRPIYECDLATINRPGIFNKKKKISIEGSNVVIGQLIAYYDNSALLRKSSLAFLKVIGIALFIGSIFIFILVQILKILNQDIIHLVKTIVNDSEVKRSNFKSYIYEFDILGKKILKSQQEASEHKIAMALTESAQQVSHDIKSPLSALSMIMPDLNTVPETTRLILRSSIQRIQDIANNLSAKKPRSQGEQAPQEEKSIQLLSGCIEEIISEKRLNFRSKMGIVIEGDLARSYGLFAHINLVEFKRVLSNLINNAVEAFNENEQGQITVHLDEISQKKRAFIRIIVEDDGSGIPDHVLAKLGQKGASFGKENHASAGQGLGLYHARKTLESWQGELNIASEVGVGTKMILTLPMASPPDWFVSKLEISAETAIVILDDDEGIHQTWDKKIKESEVAGKHLFHLCCPDDFTRWMAEKAPLFEKALYLCDFELIGCEKTGLDLIEEFSLGENAVLVTSHYEEKDIKMRCEKAHIKLIPKMIVAHVPLLAAPTVEDAKALAPKDENVQGQVVLLDDDILTRMVWETKAKEKGVDLKIFEFPDELYKELDEIPKESVFYIDSSLANEEKGEDVALELFKRGHENLYLATGYEPEAFKKLDYLKGVIGKVPPW